MKKSIAFHSLIAAALVTGAGASMADVSYSAAEKLRASGEVLPVERILEIAKQAKPGEVEDIELDRDLGRYVYEVEIRDANGQEWDLEIDAKSGEVLATDADD